MIYHTVRIVKDLYRLLSLCKYPKLYEGTSVHQLTLQGIHRSLGNEVITIPIPFALGGDTGDFVLDFPCDSKNQALGHPGEHPGGSVR